MSAHNDKQIYSPSWPTGDVFFGSGVKSLLAELEQKNEIGDYFFIDLNRHTLKYFFQDFPRVGSKKIIIISSRRLMPLAFFWLTESQRVCAVFESCVPVQEIIRVLNALPPDSKSKMFFPALRVSEKLTLREVLFLGNYLEKGEVAHLQMQFSMKYSTLKNCKASLARKLSTRKLEHLLILK